MADPAVVTYIQSAPEHFRLVMLKIRELIYEIVPDATEAIKWSTPVFSRRDNICSLSTYKNHVTFAFFNGLMLHDPNGELLGSGDKMRHIKLRSLDELDEDQVKKWILEGFYQ